LVPQTGNGGDGSIYHIEMFEPTSLKGLFLLFVYKLIDTTNLNALNKIKFKRFEAHVFITTRVLGLPHNT
jgi:hypothetical protein